ncbi:MAG: hypothetical protein AWU55_1919 [Halomonadaceae bacterium T82-2]|nr:MAG: hypothetical protein AWU55_1919 [Halomonadaceae bacterium T82-2]
MVGHGLSPRLRGSALEERFGVGVGRVIPAPAGIGTMLVTFFARLPGYPRACGDRSRSMTSAISRCGLSPRLRGSAADHLGADRLGRVIPAPAGIGSWPIRWAATSPGYPRACGDRAFQQAAKSTAAGLSPRLRGSGVAHVRQPGGRRVIPAPAGIGSVSPRPSRQPTGYPRACGDRGNGSRPGKPRPGLSPRLRGSGAQPGPRPGWLRVIPAPAGIGCGCARRPCRSPGYPRACGDRLSTTIGA